MQSDNELSDDYFSENGGGDVTDTGDSISDDGDLPVPHAPREHKWASKQKTKKTKVDVNWTDKTEAVKIEHKFLQNQL